MFGWLTGLLGDRSSPSTEGSVPREGPLPPLRLGPLLFLAASPSTMDRVRFDREISALQRLRETLSLEEQALSPFHFYMTLPVRDFARRVDIVKPRFIHFSGHGQREGIWLESESGDRDFLPAENLTQVLAIASRVFPIRCVVLNACYMDALAEALSAHVDFVVGTEGLVDDECAVVFTQGFYEAVFAGFQIEEAFETAVEMLETRQWRRPKRPFKPVLKRRTTLSELERLLAYDENRAWVVEMLLGVVQALDPKEAAYASSTVQLLLDEALRNRVARATATDQEGGLGEGVLWSAVVAPTLVRTLDRLLLRFGSRVFDAQSGRIPPGPTEGGPPSLDTFFALEADVLQAAEAALSTEASGEAPLTWASLQHCLDARDRAAAALGFGALPWRAHVEATLDEDLGAVLRAVGVEPHPTQLQALRQGTLRVLERALGAV